MKYIFNLVFSILFLFGSGLFSQNLPYDVKLIPFRFDSTHWGYVDQQMKIVIGPKYHDAEFMNAKGVAMVSIYENGKLKTNAFVNDDGTEIIPEYKCQIHHEVSSGLSTFYFLETVITDQDNPFQLIDDKGKFIRTSGCELQPLFLSSRINNAPYYSEFYPLHSVIMAWPPKYIPCGFIRDSDHEFFPVTMDRESYLIKDLFVYRDSSTNLVGIKTFDGKVIVKAGYKQFDSYMNNFSSPSSLLEDMDGLLSVTGANGKTGFINLAGDTIVPIEFTTIQHPMYGKIQVEYKKPIHDSLGHEPDPAKFYYPYEEILYDTYYSIYTTSGELIYGPSKTYKSALRWNWPEVIKMGEIPAFINAKGDTIIPKGCTSIGGFENGTFWVYGPDGSGIIDLTGKFIYPLSKFYVFKMGTNLYELQHSDNIGSITGFGDTLGNIFIKPNYGNKMLDENRFVVGDGKKGQMVIDRDKNIIFKSGENEIKYMMRAGDNEYFFTRKGWADKKGRKFWNE